VERLEQRFRGLETEFHEAYWGSQVESTPSNDRRRADIELELRRIKGDVQALAEVKVALAEEIHEPELRRQLEVLRLSLTGNQMQESHRAALVELSTAVESEFATFRPEVDTRRLTENDIENVLKSSDDVELRERVWSASKEVGGRVSDRIREMARLRNEVAHDLGYADYYQMALDLQEMNEEWLFAVLDELEQLTLEPFRQIKNELDESLRNRFSTKTLYPWHYADPFFQALPPDGRLSLDPVLEGVSAPEAALRTFAAWGIDLGRTIDHSDLYPRERKCQHAFCLDVDRSGDVRILANVIPGERWVEVMLHESGHAAYDVCIDRELPYLLRRPAHTFVTEAIAIMSGRFVRNIQWLSDVAGVNSEEMHAIESNLRAAVVAQSLLFIRWGLVMVHFERALYADPEGELDTRWWELVQRLQLLNPPPGRSAPDWAAKIHVAAAPVYYHNYLLGELLASQLEETCEERFGGHVVNADAGRLLRDRLFSRGASIRWDALIEDVTGSPLSAKAFASSART
jgi:peptidyl-dipeptidase A